MKRLMFSLAAAAALAVSSSASAVVLTPNDQVPLPGTTVAAEPQLAGTVLEDWVQPFSYVSDAGANTVSGTVQSRVVRSSVDGTLDFYWRVVSDATSTGELSALRLGGFLTDVYNANYRTDGLGTNAPDYARWFGGTDGNVNFVFDTNAIGAGESSMFLLLDTDAVNYSSNGVYDLASTDGISGTFQTFIPNPVPEPETYAMLGLGLAALAVMRRRQRQT